MKPAPFAYADPGSVEDVVALLAEHGDDAVVLAGGQSLVPDLNFRRRRPRLVIDIGRITTLSGVTVDGLSVSAGAGARVGELAAVHPDGGVAEAVSRIGHPQIRSRTTVGGAAAQAEPAGEIPTVLAALDGIVELTSVEGVRLVPASEWFVGPRRTARRSDELVTRVVLDVLGGRSGFAELSRRPQDLPIVGMFAGRGASGWRVAIGGFGEVPVRAAGCEAALDTGDLDAAVAALTDLPAVSDVLASADHRRSIAGSLLRTVVGAAEIGAAA